MLERRVQRHLDARAPAGSQISAPTSGLNMVAAVPLPASDADERPHGRVAEHRRPRHVVLEERLHVAGGRRQRHPQLHPVQPRRPGRRHLRVADAASGGHQVQLARPDERVAADAVAVVDLALEEPAHGLQAGVRMRRDAHPAGHRHVVRPVVVDEAPAADQRPAPLREGAAHGHRARAAERNVARLQDLHRRRRRPRAAEPTTSSAGSRSRLLTRHPRSRTGRADSAVFLEWSRAPNLRAPHPRRRRRAARRRRRRSRAAPRTRPSPPRSTRRAEGRRRTGEQRRGSRLGRPGCRTAASSRSCSTAARPARRASNPSPSPSHSHDHRDARSRAGRDLHATTTCRTRPSSPRRRVVKTTSEVQVVLPDTTLTLPGLPG